MNESTCQEIRDQLHAYRAGEVSPLARLKIERHLDSCDGCGAELWLQSELENAAKIGPDPISDIKKREMLERVHRRTVDLERRSEWALPLPPLRIWGPAVAAAAAAIIAFFAYSGLRMPEVEGWIQTDMGVQAFAPEPARIRFEHGAAGPILHLGEQAVLVKFDRPPDVGPLEVHTPQATVVVRGTVFFVDTEGAETVVGVQRGVVEVVADDGATGQVAAAQQLSATEQAVTAEAADSPYFAMLDALFPPPPPEVEEELLPLPPFPEVRTQQEPESVLVARVVRRRLHTIRECYQHELKNQHGLAGNIDVEIVIGESGQVRRARIVNDTVGSDVVADCVTSRIRRWRFHQPHAGALQVQIPFIFTLANGGEVVPLEP